MANAYRNDIAVINQGLRNANDGLSSLQIKDGALGNISTLLDRLATLATQAASGETTNGSRATINTEFQDVLAEIDREANVAGLTTTATFSVFVSNSGANGKIAGTIGLASQAALSLTGHVVTSQATAESAVAAVTSAVTLARHCTGDGRHVGEPSAVRDRPGAVADREQQGGREPHP